MLRKGCFIRACYSIVNYDLNKQIRQVNQPHWLIAPQMQDHHQRQAVNKNRAAAELEALAAQEEEELEDQEELEEEEEEEQEAHVRSFLWRSETFTN
jgi:myo-inositol-1-phosphate synthase